MIAKKLQRKIFSTLWMVGLVIVLTSCVRSGLSVINGIAAIGDFEKFTDLSYGTHQSQKLDVYVPSNQSSDTRLDDNSFNRAKPIVVFYYGGCWGACRTYLKDAYDFVADTLTAEGYIVVLGDYRLYPTVNFSEMMQDAADIVKWTRTHAENYGGDADKIFLMGHSAGAHLAAMLSIDENHLGKDITAVKGFIGLAGPYDFLPFNKKYMFELFGQDKDQQLDSQPVHLVNGNEAPHLLLHGLGDTKVHPKNATKLARVLQQKGVEHQHLTYQDMGHGKLLAALARPIKNTYPVQDDIIDFLKRHEQ